MSYGSHIAESYLINQWLSGSRAIGGFFSYCHQSQRNHVMCERLMMQFLCENGTFFITCIESVSCKFLAKLSYEDDSLQYDKQLIYYWMNQILYYL